VQTDPTPMVDVVILSLNRLEDTLQAIKSIEEQHVVRPILWIVDQGSSEHCLQKLREKCCNNPNCHLVELGENIGVPAGRNRGMSLGSSEYIVSIDNDVVLESSFTLKHVIERFRSDPNLAVIGFKILIYETGEYDRGSWVYPRKLFIKQDESFLTTRFCGAGHAIRRKALEETKMYDETLFFYWEEVDLSYQLITRGYTIVYDPKIQVLHKVSKEARTSWSENRFYYLVRNALYLEYKYNRSIIRVLIKAAGYLLKGIYNGWLGQTVRGMRDTIPMIRSTSKFLESKLDASAKEYIAQNEMIYRGPIWNRIREEVFESMDKENSAVV
jgi:GT2 family glycosyltransferase